MKKLHIDIETYSSESLKTSGAYRYFEAIDFEILLVAYAFGTEDITVIDLAQGEELPKRFTDALMDYRVEKHAHNANFERQAFKKIGIDVPAKQWHCSMVKAAYCGWPLSLGAVSDAMGLGVHGKLTTGRALIKYFCTPCKPSKANDQRSRNFPEHDLVKWEDFKVYCKWDVVSEREVDRRLEKYDIPEFERVNWLLDQKINDRGILIDIEMAKNAFDMDARFSQRISQKIKDLTGVDNPGSAAQLKKWLSDVMQKEITTLTKDSVLALIEEAGPSVAADVLTLRKKLAKTSIKKYTAMQNCVCEDGRAHGLFQFYGASRTGRWAGGLIQLQNLPQNHLEALSEVREVVASGNYDLLDLLYDDISSVLSQLIRTAFVARPGYTFAVADFSAIEARVIAWLADEKWRLDIFNSHGKIYEASAAMMFSVPIESITKGSSMRAKGKVAELALGYQGSLGALKRMGGEEMGLSDTEMRVIVKKWRLANPHIVKMWAGIENCAKAAIRGRKQVVSKYHGITFDASDKVLTIKLPSGRKLFYQQPSFTVNKFQQESIQFKGTDQDTKQWGDIETYGGKLTENIVQAIARDILALSMSRLDQEGFDIVMHVHDEAISEVPIEDAENSLKTASDIMGKEVPWAPGLPLTADGYITPFYKKD